MPWFPFPRHVIHEGASTTAVWFEIIANTGFKLKRKSCTLVPVEGLGDVSISLAGFTLEILFKQEDRIAEDQWRAIESVDLHPDIAGHECLDGYRVEVGTKRILPYD